jgi:hypothetical protein
MTTQKALTAEERAVAVTINIELLLPEAAAWMGATWPTDGIYGYALTQIRSAEAAVLERCVWVLRGKCALERGATAETTECNHCDEYEAAMREGCGE